MLNFYFKKRQAEETIGMTLLVVLLFCLGIAVCM